MEKKELIVNYEGGGVKTLSGFGVFFHIIGSLALLTAIIGGFLYLQNIESSYTSDEDKALLGASLARAFFPLGLISFFFGAVCIGLSSIAKTALYKRTIFEQQYDIHDKSETNIDKQVDDVNETNGLD
jgi:hypothetical protein